MNAGKECGGNGAMGANYEHTESFHEFLVRFIDKS
jgi:hypothetical protein